MVYSLEIREIEYDAEFNEYTSLVYTLGFINIHLIHIF